MSYLNHILGEIEGSAPSDPTPPLVAQMTVNDATAGSDISNGTAAPKRKAESGLDDARKKLPRKDYSSPGSTEPTSAAPPSRPALPDSGKPAPYRGTAASASAPSASKSASRPPLKTTTPSKPNATPSAASPAPAKAPAKGSYAEIIARGKAGQPTDIMKIQNKKSEPKLATPRDRQKILGARSGSGEREIQSAGEGSSNSAMSRRQPGEYKGNARASSAAPATKSTRPSYTGTARLNPPAGRAAKKDKVRNAGYANWGDDDDDDEEEDELEEGEYQSDDDMEATMFDVAQEEEQSSRAAKKEDAEELARLNELERQKRQRKQMLEKMAADKRNKKRVL